MLRLYLSAPVWILSSPRLCHQRVHQIWSRCVIFMATCPLFIKNRHSMPTRLRFSGTPRETPAWQWQALKSTRATRGKASIVMLTNPGFFSYYGNNSVFLMTKSNDISSVPLDKKGPVHNVKWSPTGTQFAICYGKTMYKLYQFFCRCRIHAE